MGASPREAAFAQKSADIGLDAPYSISYPLTNTVPVIYASPHSGHFYPQDFIAASPLNPTTLRRSEDAFVDEIYECCTRWGSPLLKANYPRAYIDVNREPYELDPNMFDSPLPSYVNVDSPRALAGLGTVAKMISNGVNIYSDKLSFSEVEARIKKVYHPYHAALRTLIETTKERFDSCLLIDCHSMPSSSPGVDGSYQSIGADIILGDRFGTSCSPWIVDCVHSILSHQGFKVKRNRPYAGGFTTQHYGDPANKIHALQIELNRALYMDEASVTALNNLAQIKARMASAVEEINQAVGARL